MTLFWKIFLWFLLATATVVGVSIFISWTTQDQPFRDRWKVAVSSQMNVYAEAAKQIYDSEGEEGAEKFLGAIERNYENSSAYIISESSEPFRNKASGKKSTTATQRAAQSGNVEFEHIARLENYAAKSFVTAKGETMILVMQFELPDPPAPFSNDLPARIIRILAILLTAGIVCYAMARYLVKPVVQLRLATRKIASGQLDTRIEIRRNDEFGKLAKDFNEMSERIESLISAQKRLTMDISHELRSPLARMNVALELAKSKTGPEASALLERIETESNRLNEMISDILKLSKLETQSEAIEKGSVNLTELFSAIVTDAEFEAKGNGKSVEVLQKDEVTLHGNRELLRSAIENVLRNAIRYANKRIQVSLAKVENTLVIKIRDDGGGVPEKDLPEIFKPFYRVDEARERRSGGIGIGLAIALQAVQAHNGRISAENLNEGLCVEIILPL